LTLTPDWERIAAIRPVSVACRTNRKITPMFLHRVFPALLMLLLLAGPVAAQQPTSVNPTASSVKEKQLLEALKPGSGSTVAGRVSIPDARAGNLIQPAGAEFRVFHQETLSRIGLIAIPGMLALLCLFYFVRGRVPIEGGPSGDTIVRFGWVSRFVHWLTATSFLALALSGLNLVFGKSVLLPVIGASAFSGVSQLGKFVHNYVSFAFALGIILMFLMWVRDNLPSLRDIRWIAQAGGLLGVGHPPADRFNAGQKLMFWSTIVGGAALSVSGYIMMFRPGSIELSGMQFATIVHGVTGLVLVAIIAAHIYIGSVGMEGAFDAMGNGTVDLNWAKSHHSIWVDKVAAKRPQDISHNGTDAVTQFNKTMRFTAPAE
jgi:formate dehydrogenase subunit gamma